MNTKFYSLFLLFFLTLNCVKAQNIDFTYKKFKDYLLTSSPENEIAKDSNGTAIAIDTNGDGEISEQEALNVYNLNLNASEFSYIQNPEIEKFSTEELKYFYNVRTFYCSGLLMDYSKTIDLSGLINLSEVYVESDYTRKYTPNVVFPDFMPNLKVLHYAYGLLDFDKMPLIEDLNIAGGFYSDITISNVTSLKKLRVPSDIPGTLTLTNLPNLNDFKYSSLSSPANTAETKLIYLENLPALEELEIRINNTNGLTIKNLTIKNLPGLMRLKCGIELGITGPIGLIGIENLILDDLPKLNYLDCSNNMLTSLALLNNLADLTYLDCSYNNLTNLNLPNSTKLDYLNCYENRLTSLDLSQNQNLQTLDIGSNLINELGISKNTQLANLSVFRNKITRLDLVNAPLLKKLNLSSTYLTEIDLSNNILLEELISCSNNIVTLNLSNNPNISNLEFTSLKFDDYRIPPKLENLIIKNGIIDKWLAQETQSYSLKKLKIICCDNEEEVELVKNNFLKNHFEPDNVSVVTDCNQFLETDDIPSSSELKLSLYPNPVKNTLFISSKETIKKAEIVDNTGKLILSQVVVNNQLNVSSFPKGIYFISLYSDKGRINERFIKE